MEKSSTSTKLHLTVKGFTLKLNGIIYTCCVRSCLMHGSDTWPVDEHVRTELVKIELKYV